MSKRASTLVFDKWCGKASHLAKSTKNEIDTKAGKAFGFRGLYSQFILNPNFMFVGINPGTGYDIANEIDGGIWIDNKSEDSLFDEYGFPENHGLRKGIKEIFKAAKLESHLRAHETHMYTNIFHLATSGSNELLQVLRSLNDRQLFEQQSLEVLRELIEISSPKVIICLGKMAYDKLKASYASKNEFEAEFGWKAGCGYFKIKDSDLIVFGTKRRYSAIVEQPEVAKTLQGIIKKHAIVLS